MAEYITADRWITGVATHKTKSGRILCTGFGCVGCFPHDFPEIACELEVYDSKTGLLFAESWTDALSNESCTENQQIRSAKQRCRLQTKKSPNSLERNAVRNTESGEFEKLFLTECGCEIYETHEERNKDIFIDREKPSTQLTVTEDNSLKEIEFPFNKVHAQKDKTFRVEREDCVCLFFAIEYNYQSRQLSHLSILEIVNFLTTIMHVNEIKYVQRLNGLWHIVLRTRKHLPYLLTNGVTVRDKCYKVVPDDMYCEKVN